MITLIFGFSLLPVTPVSRIFITYSYEFFSNLKKLFHAHDKQTITEENGKTNGFAQCNSDIDTN
jgi:hypothetical protein